FMMLDPTWAPFSRELWSTAEQEQQYLIGTPQGETLMTTPYSPPEENFTRIKAETGIAASGDLASEVTVLSGGYAETGLRRWFVYTPKTDLAAIFAGIMSKISQSAMLSSFELIGLKDLDKAFKMKFSYGSGKFAMLGNDGGILKFPLSTHIFADNKRLAGYLPASELKERKHPLRLICTFLYEVEENIKLPDGYTFAALPENVAINGKIASFEAEFKGKNGVITLKYKLAVKKRFIKPDEYVDFKAAVDGMRALAKETVLLKKVKK
ncbi:MAG: DUF3858 domain-containing protein, partial [Deltaproteobacteria bacterium]|nr:DUF3858 domain-containing protein [Deltaproteobacteria bacterium]